MPESASPGGRGSAPGGVWSGGCLLPGGGGLVWGVSALGGGVVSQYALRQTPPFNRITDTSKNITLATTSLRPVNIVFY